MVRSISATKRQYKRTLKANGLEPAKSILRSFLMEMTEIYKIDDSRSDHLNSLTRTEEDSISDSSPSLQQKDEAYAWIYAEPRNFRLFMQRPPSPPITGYYAEPASPLYEEWILTEKDFFGRGSIIPPPGIATLGDYLVHLYFLVTIENKRHAVWKKSLRSFVEYLRLDMEPDQLYPLELLFPEWMEIRPGYIYKRLDGVVKRMECQTITRKIEEAAFEIDILATSEILKNLASTVLYGRPNSQQNAAEALGFSWICLTVGSASLPAIEKVLFSTPCSALRSFNSTSSRSQYCIHLMTEFGTTIFPISKILYEFLLAMPRDPKCDLIFSNSWRAIYRSLVNQGIKQSKRAATLGKISFLTFMSSPHEAIGQR